MNRNLNILLIVFVFILIIILFLKINILQESLVSGTIIFINNVAPFLYTMIFLNKLLTYLNFPYYFKRLFKDNTLCIFIMSILSGSPINAIIINEYLDNNFIDHNSASILLSFTNFNNPLFLYHYLKLIIVSNKEILIILSYIYLSNFIILVLFYKKIKYKKSINNKMKYSHIFTKSINESILIIINIFATFIIFKIIVDLFIPYNSCISIILKGLIEITQGLNSLSILNISIHKKKIISLIIIIFSGFSIHIQISNILSKHDINYKYFYLIKIIQIICVLIIF